MRTTSTYLTLPDRLQRNILPVPESGCWLWIGPTDRGGYGRLKWKGHTALAHRVVYRILKGRMPASRRVLDHLCRVRCCVNPDHLEPVTVVENNLRAADTLAFWLKSRGIRIPFYYRHGYKPPFPSILFWVLFAATFLLSIPAGAITGNVVFVLDGDTIEVLGQRNGARHDY